MSGAKEGRKEGRVRNEAGEVARSSITLDFQAMLWFNLLSEMRRALESFEYRTVMI